MALSSSLFALHLLALVALEQRCGATALPRPLRGHHRSSWNLKSLLRLESGEKQAVLPEGIRMRVLPVRLPSTAEAVPSLPTVSQGIALELLSLNLVSRGSKGPREVLQVVAETGGMPG